MKDNLLRDTIVDFSEAKTSIVDKQLELIREINSIIKNNPLGDSLQLTLASKDLKLEQDEILVQEVDIQGRKMLLVPKNIKELGIDDLTHETQVINLKDKKSLDFLESTVAASCLKRTDLMGKKVHIYD